MVRLLAVLILISFSVNGFAAERALAKVSSGGKVALIIGNSKYKRSPLKNPVNDARLMDRTLKLLGFQTITITDADQNQMKRSVDTFGRKIRGASVAFFYYAGHGVQVNGRNYLIPVNAAIEGESDVEYESLDSGRVLGKMHDSGSTVNIIMLDACRDNPFARSFRSSAKGLATVNAPRGSYIAYATAPGSTASDGTGDNGVFTEAFVKAVKRPGAEIASIFKEIRRIVDGKTSGRQTPWTSSSLTSDFYFIPPKGSVVYKPGTQSKVAMAERPKSSGNFDLSALKAQAEAERKTEEEAKRQAEEIKKRHLAEMKETYDQIAYLASQGADKELIKKAIIQFMEVFGESVSEAIKTDDTMDKLRDLASAYGVSIGGKRYTDPVTGMEFLFVEGGCYYMGSHSGEDEERPVHEVCVDDFYMGKYEVTNVQYRKYMSGHNRRKSFKGHSLSGENQPAVFVSWDDAKSFIKWLNGQSDAKYRLPTEAEWEYAVRGGTTTKRYWGDDSSDACRYANVLDRAAEKTFNWNYEHNCDDAYAVTAPVGSFEANPFGLHDMLGNVEEWIEDLYSIASYSEHQRKNPVYTESAAPRGSRGIRGSSWLGSPDSVRSARRGAFSQDARKEHIGFRLLRMID